MSCAVSPYEAAASGRTLMVSAGSAIVSPLKTSTTPGTLAIASATCLTFVSSGCSWSPKIFTPTGCGAPPVRSRMPRRSRTTSFQGFDGVREASHGRALGKYGFDGTGTSERPRVYPFVDVQA